MARFIFSGGSTVIPFGLHSAEFKRSALNLAFSALAARVILHLSVCLGHFVSI